MKLVEFQLRDTPPIGIIEMRDLTEVLVVAGPNGIGKTRALTALLAHFQNPAATRNVRIKLVATTSGEERLWGLSALDTADPNQAQKLRTLQRRQKRGELRGGVLNFDSSRSFENIQPYAWSWDFQDPFEEAIAGKARLCQSAIGSKTLFTQCCAKFAATKKAFRIVQLH